MAVSAHYLHNEAISSKQFTNFTTMHLTPVRAILFCILFAFLAKNFSAQVKINEYSGANISGPVDNWGNRQDWIELYNPGSTTINISGFYLSDDAGNISKWQFPVNATISAQGFMKVFASGTNTVATNGAGIKEYHTNFKLTQTKPEKIIIANTLGMVVDSLTIHPNQKNHSRGRTPDGSPTWKVYTTPTLGASNTGTSYIDYLKKPDFSAGPGTYANGFNLNLSTAQSNAKIKYTTDGSDPNTSATAQTSASPISVTINATKVVRAICIDAATPATYLNSFIETNTYFLNPDNNFTFPVVSVCVDTTSLFNNQSASDAVIEYFEKDKQFILETFGTSAKNGTNATWAFPQKSFDYTVIDEYGYDYTNYHQFFEEPMLGYSNRKDFEKVIFRAAGSDNFPSGGTGAGGSGRPCHMRDAFCQSYAFRKGLNVDGQHYEPIILFINGKYRGIYELREEMDEKYTDYYYGQTDIFNLKYQLGYINSSIPSQTDWTNTYNFIMGNPMTNPANYWVAANTVELNSLIDYMIYNTYLVNSDFINGNAAWWKGLDANKDKHFWRYWLWNMDNTMGLGQNVSGIANTSPTGNPCDYNTAFPASSPAQTGHAALLMKLMTNTEFKTKFLNRYADLLNTSLSCDSLMEHYNYFKSFLTPEMGRHIARWAPGATSMNKWKTDMDSLKSWITQRCKHIDSLVVDCYDVKGPYDFCLDVFPPGAGNIGLNSIVVSNFQFGGQYYGGLNMNATALPNPNYYFDHWEPGNIKVPDSSLLKNPNYIFLFDTTSCLKAVFKLKEPFKTEGEAMVPSGFSPNGDGNNDILNVYGTLNATHFELEIYNRWGQMVFQSRDKTKGWDGKFGGAEAPVGVYAYRFNVTIDGNEISKKGNVTLIR